jgi:hypothetical protein
MKEMDSKLLQADKISIPLSLPYIAVFILVPSRNRVIRSLLFSSGKLQEIISQASAFADICHQRDIDKEEQGFVINISG